MSNSSALAFALAAKAVTKLTCPVFSPVEKSERVLYNRCIDEMPKYSKKQRMVKTWDYYRNGER